MGRYERQLRVFGEDGQAAIGRTCVGIVGCGGLGTNVATALAVAGVGGFVLMDPDVPEESNLNRQYVFCAHVGPGKSPSPKAEILADWIETRNPDAHVTAHAVRFSKDTEDLLSECDVLVDCLDSVGGRMDLNRYSVESGKPLVHGGIDGFVGEVAICIPGAGPCLRCMTGDLPERKGAPASIGAVVSTVGSMEAAEVLKIATGRHVEPGTLLSMDLETWRFRTFRFERDPECPVCSKKRISEEEVPGPRGPGGEVSDGAALRRPRCDQKVRTLPSMIMSLTLSTLSSQSAVMASASDFQVLRCESSSAWGRTICTEALRGSETGFPIWESSLTRISASLVTFSAMSSAMSLDMTL